MLVFLFCVGSCYHSLDLFIHVLRGTSLVLEAYHECSSASEGEVVANNLVMYAYIKPQQNKTKYEPWASLGSNWLLSGKETRAI